MSAANTAAEPFAVFGPIAHTDADLIALVLGSSETTDKHRAIVSEGLAALRKTPAALACYHDINARAAARLAAALELGRRSILDESPVRPRLDAPETVAAYLTPRHAHHEGEVFGILALDSKHRLLGERIVATGGRHSVAVTPADVFQAALPFRPRSVVAFHNHPSGDPHPSEEDKALTYRLARSGEVLGIALVDHIVLGGRSFASFKQLGLL